MKIINSNTELGSASSIVIGVLLNFVLVYALFGFLVSWIYNPNSQITLGRSIESDPTVMQTQEADTATAKAQYKFE